MALLAMPLSRLEGARVRAWHVHDGQLWVELDDRGVAVACDCGRPHLLPTEEPGAVLRLHCHACGRAADLSLAPAAARA